MSQKLYLNILRIGAIASLFIVFNVNKDYLFPFITSKQIPFNILMEILFVIWITFIVKYPKYRPKKSYLTLGLASFFGVMILSCFTGVDFNLSFWGDVERMLGAFHIAHFLILYFIIITVFRKWDEWRIFLLFSVVVSVFVSLKGISGQLSYSTIGNSAYVSGYLIFNMFFTIILFVKDKSSAYKWFYLLALPLILLSFNKANTTGAIVGLGFSLIVMTFLYGILAKNKKIKIATLAIFVFLSGFSYWVLTHKDSDFVRNTPLIENTRQISLQKNTFQTRLISWKAGIRDLKEHPLLGTGHGNYAIIFDKYFEPSFYNYTRSETYFDRAHNNLVDIASTTGIIGLLAYLSIFAAVAYYLIVGYRRGKISLNEFVIVSTLLTAYFVQNLAVFDSFVTYMGLMITLAYIYWMSNREEMAEEHSVDEKVSNKEIYAFIGVGLAMSFVVFQYNIKPSMMLTQTIEAQRNANNTAKVLEIYKEALADDGILDRDSRTSLIRLFLNPGRYKGLSESEKAEAVSFVIEQAEKNVAYNEGDSMNQMILAQLLDVVSRQYASNPEKFVYYSDQSMNAIEEALAASPKRVPVYYQKAQIQMTRGENDAALDTLRYAYSLNPNYWDSACHLSRTLFSMNERNHTEEREEEAWRYMDECVGSKGGVKLLQPANHVKTLIVHYTEKGDTERVIKLYERLTQMEPKEADHLINLVKLYASVDQKDKAVETVEKAIRLNPSIEAYAQEFIEGLK